MVCDQSSQLGEVWTTIQMSFEMFVEDSEGVDAEITSSGRLF